MKIDFRNITQVEGDIKVTLCLTGGSDGYLKKPQKVVSVPAIKTLGDIRHDRNRRPPNLIPQSKVGMEGLMLRMLINILYNLPGSLPGNQIFKPINRHEKYLH